MRRTTLTLLGPIPFLLATACADGLGDRPARAALPAAAASDAVEAVAHPDDAPRSDPPAGLAARPEAVSLLGEPLYPLAADSATEARLLARLDSAQAAYEARPGSSDAIIWLGRWQAYLGRYRDAIETFSEGIALHRDDPRFYRHRGHRYITVRQLGRAVADLEHAARLVSGEEDIVEPDGQPNDAGVPRSTLHTNIWYHLGLARYLQHDFQGAAHAFRWGLEIAPNDDMRVAMADWLWLSLMRTDREAEAAALLERITPGMELMENQAYHRRLMLYKGELARDTLIPGPAEPGAEPDADPGPIARATYGYGLAAWHLLRGDRIRARTELERVLETGYWPAFGYIAAEAELLALGDGPPRPDPPGTTREFVPAGGDEQEAAP